MWSWLNRIFPGGGQAKPATVRVRVPLDRLIQKMQEPKEVHLVISGDGNVTAFCKACTVFVKTAETEELIWYKCPNCKQVSFNPKGNRERDIELATREWRHLRVRDFLSSRPIPRPSTSRNVEACIGVLKVQNERVFDWYAKGQSRKIRPSNKIS